MFEQRARKTFRLVILNFNEICVELIEFGKKVDIRLGDRNEIALNSQTSIRGLCA